MQQPDLSTGVLVFKFFWVDSVANNSTTEIKLALFLSVVLQWDWQFQSVLHMAAMAYFACKVSLIVPVLQNSHDVFQLAASSDVLVENYLPGKLDELGLGYEELRKLNPRLIYVTITGYSVIYYDLHLNHILITFVLAQDNGRIKSLIYLSSLLLTF